MPTKQNAIYALTFIGALVAYTAPAAAVVTSSSSAYGVKANVNVLANVLDLKAGIGSTSGSAPGAYDKSNTVAKVTAGTNLTTRVFGVPVVNAKVGIGTGVITTRAKSDVPNAVNASASATVDNLGVNFTPLNLLGLDLVSLNVGARAITSTTQVGVGPDGLWGSGSSDLAGLNITGGLLGLLKLDFSALAHAGPNTAINLGAISLILNEQQQTITDDSISFFTNALRITLTDYALNGHLLNGNIIVGHSEARISGYVPPVVTPPAAAVPEPATWAMMILGFGMVGFGARQRRSRMARVTA
ncbi:choice-of-anchor P family protein [Sphingomonas quercus]|uniref:PEPxxWA-CTERM sorting domain-containing protein n=1 Tax=Sphingomonas quercus TaxID=2842451 RepID=A0ABS6BKR7_9SPHN|nr:choice-of-anchor P family protein [Sphingomonas quercus]MBU3078898.1 PEPxxWA-CTERM sorting domain-containing protein [Sphingomonas quercus]